jgi:hypothetical protein
MNHVHINETFMPLKLPSGYGAERCYDCLAGLKLPMTLAFQCRVQHRTFIIPSRISVNFNNIRHNRS